MRFSTKSMLPTIPVDEDAFNPRPRPEVAGCIKSFSLQKQAQVSCVTLQADSRASLLRLGSGALSVSHRAQLDLRFGNLPPGRLSLRERWPSSEYPQLRGPRGTDVVPGT